MHRLQRGRAPACLDNYRHGQHRWNNLSAAEKQEIWQALDAMQQERCAYCEAPLYNNRKHIEHFRQRALYPQGTFEWSNLFGSCNRSDSCGKHKDRCGPYNHRNLIKPDEENPDDYFVFVSDGTIAARSTLSDHARRRANETLRIFNLDARHGALRQRRRQAAAGYLQTAQELQEVAEAFDESEWRPFLEQELEAIQDEPFVTVIRHALLGSQP